MQQNKGARKDITPRRTSPPVDILKINTDGAFRAETLSGGWVFTIRNQEGMLVAAGAGNLEHVSDALHAEALAMLHAMNTTIQLGCDRVMLEINPVSLKQAVSSEAYDLSALGPVFREIKF